MVVVFAWTNPTGNPPTGSGVISVVGGNVGIGTVAPRGKFDVDGPGAIYLADDTIAGTTQSLYLPGHIFLAPYNGTNVSYLQARRSDNSGTTELRLRTYNAGVLQESVSIKGTGYVGIGTTLPLSKLHIVGEMRTTNSAGQNRLWGQGRPVVDVMNAAGECTNTVGSETFKISRSNINVTWDGSAAACPAGWWVCTVADRGVGACNTAGNLQYEWCDPGASSDEFSSSGKDGLLTKAWVADGAIGASRRIAQTVNTLGVSSIEENCSHLPSWCCSY